MIRGLWRVLGRARFWVLVVLVVALGVVGGAVHNSRVAAVNRRVAYERTPAAIAAYRRMVAHERHAPKLARKPPSRPAPRGWINRP